MLTKMKKDVHFEKLKRGVMFFDLVKRDPEIVLVSISAVIGVGKSTLVERLEQTRILENHFPKDQFDIVFVQEPVALWEEKGWLQAYYKDQNKHALTFQLAVMDSHVKAVATALQPHRHTGKKVICFVERCSWDQLLFWKLQVDSKFASADAFGDETYMNNWQNLAYLIPDVKLIFFAKTSTFDVTQERLRIRQPGEEELYKYNERLYQKHLDWYTHKTGPCSVPVTELNMDSGFDKDDTKLGEMALFIANTIKEQNLFV